MKIKSRLLPSGRMMRSGPFRNIRVSTDVKKGQFPAPRSASPCGRTMSGVQKWLSFYFKGPMHAPEVYPEHDIFIQLMKLKNTLRWMRGEDLITHLGQEYYD